MERIFCSEPGCGTVMKKHPQIGGGVKYICTCGNIVNGGPNDTLMLRSGLGVGDQREIHSIEIRNAPFDAASNRVKLDCPTCGLDFLSMTIIDSKTMYSCSCGYIGSRDLYKARMFKS